MSMRCIDAIDIAILAASTIFCAAVPGIPDGNRKASSLVCSMGAGQCRSFPYLLYREKFYFFSYHVLSMYLTFTDLHLPVFGLCRPTGRGLKKGAGRCRSFTNLSIERKKYTFFTPCVKYVFDRLTPAHFVALRGVDGIERLTL